MESQVSPKNIEDRVEKMATSTETPEVKTETPAAEVKPATPAAEVKPEAKVETKAAEPEVKGEKKQPNDPAELRKWATKSSQEAAALREELKAVKAAIEKMSKKPVDYVALAKDPEALRKHIESERAEAASEQEKQFKTERDERIKSETILWKERYERDTENYPRWGKLFPLIQTLSANSDGRINWKQPTPEILRDLYVLAEQLSPTDAPAAPVAAAPATPAPVAPAAPVVTEEQIQARIDAAVAKAKTDAATGLRAEENGAGIGSQGKGGKRDGKVNVDALKKMPLKDLKAMIEKQ